jgi:phage gpG-like protein
LLLKTGRLKRSIRKISATTDRIIIGTDVPYAQIHNEGGTINTTVTVRAHTRTRRGRSENVRGHSRRMNLNIPQRQFLGNSQVLQQRIFSHITARFNSVLNN